MNKFFFIIISFMLISCTSTVRIENLAGEYYNLGNGYYGLEKYTEAITFYRKALKLNPGFSNCKYNLAKALIQADKKEDKEAAGLLEDLREKDPENINVLLTLAYIYYSSSDNSKALEIYEEILGLFPDHIDTLYNYALILWKTEKKEQAVEYFKKIITTLPEDSDTIFNLGKLYLELEDYEEAITWTAQYLEIQQDSIESLVNQDKEVSADDLEAYFTLAQCYTSLEKYFASLEIYEEILIINENNNEAWFEKSRILLTEVEDPAKGLTALAQAIELGFNDLKKITALYESPDLLGKDDITALLKEKNLLPRPKQEDESEGKEENPSSETDPAPDKKTPPGDNPENARVPDKK